MLLITTLSAIMCSLILTLMEQLAPYQINLMEWMEMKINWGSLLEISVSVRFSQVKKTNSAPGTVAQTIASLQRCFNLLSIRGRTLINMIEESRSVPTAWAMCGVPDAFCTNFWPGNSCFTHLTTCNFISELHDQVRRCSHRISWKRSTITST